MRNKLEEINLAIFAIKYGEDAAIRIADSFSDEEIINAKKLIKSKKCREAIYKRWGKKQKPKLSSIELSNRKHQFDSSMEAFKQLAALKKEVEVLDEAINTSIQAIIDIYLNTEKETKR